MRFGSVSPAVEDVPNVSHDDLQRNRQPGIAERSAAFSERRRHGFAARGRVSMLRPEIAVAIADGLEDGSWWCW